VGAIVEATPVSSPPATFDPQRLRRDFPIFERDFGGRRLAYLDSAATSLKPRVVLEAMEGYNARYTANVHRGIYTTGEEATAAYEDARVAVARFLNASDAHEIVFVRNATEAVNLVAASWGRRHIGRGDTIVLTEMEHHSNLVPWQLLAQEREANLEFVPFGTDGRLDQAAFDALLRRRPRLVAFTHKSNALGTLNPVREMVSRAHDVGSLVLVDGAQAVPHLAVDVRDLGADFYAFSGHKALGPTGSGALWARRDLLEGMPPFMSGGEMISSVRLRQTTFNEVPHKFEAGTPDVAAAIGLGAAVRYLEAIGMHAVAAHEESLTAYALEMLPREVPGFALVGSSDPTLRAGIVTFTLQGVHAHDIATLLDRVAVAVRAGHHCTQPLHERLGLSATARASFNVYSDTDHLDRLAAGLREVVRIFGGAAAPVARGSVHVATREAPFATVPEAPQTAAPLTTAPMPAAPASTGGPA
jgi:cysteine desulfurase/selenocysteine lyase